MAGGTWTLERLLDLATVGEARFEAPLTPKPPPRIFGGQILAQALAAALRTVDGDTPAHSLHAHFLRPGNGQVPMQFAVETMREGRSFSTRRVEAMQDGRVALVATVSCQAREPGLEFHTPMPQVPGPEGLLSEEQVRIDELALGADVDWLRNPLFPRMHYELRPVHPRRFAHPEPRPPRQFFWLRLVEAPPSNPHMVQAALTYVTDMMLLSTTLLPHGIFWTTTPLQEASLDHAVWFHAPAALDGWMLWDLNVEWTGNARGLARGRIFNADGTLVATVMQEGLIRLTAS